MRTIEARAYKAGDILDLAVQPAQAAEASGSWRDALRTRAPAGRAWSFWRGPDLVACAGVEPSPSDPGFATAWALMAAPRRAEWGFLLAFGRARLAEETRVFRRIEAHARCDWPGAMGALARLGFVLEAPRLAAFGRNGTDYALWAMTKRGADHGR